MKQQTAVLLCSLALSSVLVLPAAASAYRDVPEGQWYTEAVAEMTQRGCLNGVGDGTFRPDAPVTRAAVITALWRLEGQPESEAAADFSDLAADGWYLDAVSWAAEQGIAAGDGAGRFRPDAPASRQELAVILQNYGRWKHSEEARGTLELYADADQVSSWAKEAMSYAVGMGLLEGSGGRLNPAGTATRAQLAVILQRLVTPAAG